MKLYFLHQRMVAIQIQCVCIDQFSIRLEDEGEKNQTQITEITFVRCWITNLKSIQKTNQENTKMILEQSDILKETDITDNDEAIE